MFKLAQLLFIALLLSVTLQANGTLQASGASFPDELYQKWILSYEKEHNKSISYIKKGSSKGIKDVMARKVDFAGTDKPQSSVKLKKEKLHQFPSVVGAITLSYNLPNIKNLQLSRKAIIMIALGKIKYWNHHEIKKVNPTLKLPHKKLLFIHRSDGSGTTFNFTYYLGKIQPSWRRSHGVRKKVKWSGRNHHGAKGNAGVAKKILSTPYSLGYIDYASAKKYSLTMASIQNREGYFISPSLESLKSAIEYASLKSKKDFYSIIVDPKGSNSYPLVAATFILVPREMQKKNKEIAHFFNWCFKNGHKEALSLGFIPLPLKLIKEVQTYWHIKGLL